MAMHRSMDRMIARITRSGARSRRTTACLLAVLLAGLAACNAGGQSSVTPGVAGTPPASASGALPAPRSPAPTSDASSEPSPSVPTVVEPAMSPGPELKVIWERGGPTPSKPCTYSPTIDAEGRIWVAVCWDSRFWIFSPGGKFLEAWGTPGSGTGQFDFAYSAGHDSIGGIAFAPDDTFYTFDAGNLRVQHFDKNRKLMTTWGSFGTGDGQFAKPTSIAVDGQGQVFVADGARADVQVFSPDGTFVRTLAEGKAGVTPGVSMPGSPRSWSTAAAASSDERSAEQSGRSRSTTLTRGGVLRRFALRNASLATGSWTPRRCVVRSSGSIPTSGPCSSSTTSTIAR